MIQLWLAKINMGEAKKSKEKHRQQNGQDLSKYNSNQSTKDKRTSDASDFDPYYEDAKHSKYWRSMQNFKPFRFSGYVTYHFINVEVHYWKENKTTLVLKHTRFKTKWIRNTKPWNSDSAKLFT